MLKQLTNFSSGPTLAFLLIAALASPTALAQVTVYGRAHVTVDQLDNGANSAINVSSNSSRLGFRANAQVQEGLTAFTQIEQEVRYENGTGNFASRDSFVGLRGGFGEIRLGFFDTPLKIVRGQVDFFGDQIGDVRNVTRVRDNYSGPGADYDFDTRFRNGIHYRSPKFNDVTFDLHYSTNTSAGSTTTGQNDAWSTALTYSTSNTYLAGSYERKNDTGSNAMRLGAGQTLGSMRINALIQTATVKGSTLGADQDVNTYGFGASYPLSSATTIKGQYYWVQADGNERDARMFAVGADHRIGALRLLFAYARTSNDDNAVYAMSRGGHGAHVAPATPGDTTSGFSAGVRYDF